MVYELENIENLPTLREVVKMVSEAVEKIPVVHRGPFTPVVTDEDLFLLTRTNLMYSLKPNITTQGAIFGWQNDYTYGQPIFPSLFKNDTPNYMVNNVIREDAEIIYASHPLYKLLGSGIKTLWNFSFLWISIPFYFSYSIYRYCSLSCLP